MVAMSGAIMPGALGDAVDGDGHAADLRLPRGELRIGVGGHDRARRLLEALRHGARGKPAEQARELGRVERLADHAGRGEIDIGLEATRRFRRGFGRQLAPSRGRACR